jgi:beta-1,4-mannosyl-glycoprotein beta-1,4-N-acetylglucosaminyltransferase
MTRVVDGFIFYNELDMLEYRLMTLSPYVEKFILVEATQTHRGNPKPLFFEENKSRYAAYLDKIVHIVVDDFPDTPDTWVRERFQRQAIERGFAGLGLAPTDWLSIADVDEIPNPRILELIKTLPRTKTECYALNQDMYYYSLHYYNCKWRHPKLCTYGHFCANPDMEQIRMGHATILEKGGWHLSYFGDERFIQNKMTQFAHQEEFVQRNNNAEIIRAKLAKGENLFDTKAFAFLPLAENKNLPPNVEFIVSHFPGHTVGTAASE